jgi:hypothetical protein
MRDKLKGGQKNVAHGFGSHHQEDGERIWRNYALVPEALKGIFL